MKKYIDCIHVSDRCLAYDIMEALERNDKYSVEYREVIGEPRRDSGAGFEIKILKVEHPMPTYMGFSDGEPKCEENTTDDTN
jgi:hypothetical protein